MDKFHTAGSMGSLVWDPLDPGLLHEDVDTVVGRGGIRRYTEEQFLTESGVEWQLSPKDSGDHDIVRPIAAPFAREVRLVVFNGNLGRGIVKADVQTAFRMSDLNCHIVAVVHF